MRRGGGRRTTAPRRRRCWRKGCHPRISASREPVQMLKVPKFGTDQRRAGECPRPRSVQRAVLVAVGVEQGIALTRSLEKRCHSDFHGGRCRHRIIRRHRWHLLRAGVAGGVVHRWRYLLGFAAGRRRRFGRAGWRRVFGRRLGGEGEGFGHGHDVSPTPEPGQSCQSRQDAKASSRRAGLSRTKTPSPIVSRQFFSTLLVFPFELDGET